MLDIVERDGALFLAVKVVPGASRTRIAGVLGDRLKVPVAAPPEKGKANAELVRFLAGRFGVHRRDVTVVAGTSSAEKTVRVSGMSIDAVKAKLGLSELGS